MKKMKKRRGFFRSLISYDWNGNFELNKDIISDEYLGLTFNGAIIMAIVLVVMAVFQYELGLLALVKSYVLALPVLAVFIGVSYYYWECQTNYIVAHALVHIFALFSFAFTILAHIFAEDFGQQNLNILFIYIVLYPILIVERPIPKLIFNLFVTIVAWYLIVTNYSNKPAVYLIYMSTLLVATIVSYFFGCYTSWQKLRGFSRAKKDDYLSRHDEATGLRNRRNLMMDFERYEADGGVKGVIVMDINDFKSINDTYGHLVGDDAILHVANILKYTVKDHLIHYYRLGGDEFVGIVSKNCYKDMDEIASYIQNQVLVTPLCSIGQGEIPLTISVGTSLKKENESLEVLLSRADEKMYEDKQRYKESKKNQS